jgi:hypothetical protein
MKNKKTDLYEIRFNLYTTIFQLEKWIIWCKNTLNICKK